MDVTERDLQVSHIGKKPKAEFCDSCPSSFKR